MFLKVFILLSYLAIANPITSNEFKEMYLKLKKIKQRTPWKFPVDNSDFATNSTKNCKCHGSYDFIIIGGGTAGAVVANRLSANGTYSILLLEAGGDELEINQFLGNFDLTTHTDSNWGYLTESHDNICQLKSTTPYCIYPRGKVLGGSSSINDGVYARGNKNDFDNWGALGNKGWSFEEVLPYFIKSENVTDINGDKYYRGFNGPLHLSYNEPLPHEELLMKAFNEFGLKNLDYNGNQQISASKPQIVKKNGRRFSTNKAYLQPIKDKRKNLKIITRALATKIIFNKNFRGTAVHFLNNHRCFMVKVNNEIIVSAGVINSPQLLLLSGVGPNKELKKFNIPVVKNLPVGKYFEEHSTGPLIRIKTNVSMQYDSFNDLISKAINGKGTLSSIQVPLLAFKGFKSDDQITNYEIYCMYPDYSGISQKKDDKPINKIFDFILGIILYHAESRGNVTLKSANPIDFPKINPNAFSKTIDVTSMYNAIKDILGILETETFIKVSASLDEDFLSTPSCKQFDPSNKYDEEFWRCLITHLGSVALHGSGTCRMGMDAQNSVIDQKLRIHGIKNVRVVDASSFPKLPTGHPAATVIMLAEKASDIIIEDNQN